MTNNNDTNDDTTTPTPTTTTTNNDNHNNTKHTTHTYNASLRPVEKGWRGPDKKKTNKK